TVHRLREGELVTGVLAAGLPEPAARACARALARFEDPELPVPDGPGAGAVDQLMVRPFRFPPMPA
ncbi:MAG TPA: hypothetical protein VJT31_35085, partial [Rugosimonospora sp.]|nr:hypothetical protein [Rugosimonospora sp.]